MGVCSLLYCAAVADSAQPLPPCPCAHRGCGAQHKASLCPSACTPVQCAPTEALAPLVLDRPGELLGGSGPARAWHSSRRTGPCHAGACNSRLNTSSKGQLPKRQGRCGLLMLPSTGGTSRCLGEHQDSALLRQHALIQPPPGDPSLVPWRPFAHAWQMAPPAPSPQAVLGPALGPSAPTHSPLCAAAWGPLCAVGPQRARKWHGALLPRVSARCIGIGARCLHSVRALRLLCTACRCAEAASAPPHAPNGGGVAVGGFRGTCWPLPT